MPSLIPDLPKSARIIEVKKDTESSFVSSMNEVAQIAEDIPKTPIVGDGKIMQTCFFSLAQPLTGSLPSVDLISSTEGTTSVASTVQVRLSSSISPLTGTSDASYRLTPLLPSRNSSSRDFVVRTTRGLGQGLCTHHVPLPLRPGAQSLPPIVDDICRDTRISDGTGTTTSRLRPFTAVPQTRQSDQYLSGILSTSRFSPSSLGAASPISVSQPATSVPVAREPVLSRHSFQRSGGINTSRRGPRRLSSVAGRVIPSPIIEIHTNVDGNGAVKSWPVYSNIHYQVFESRLVMRREEARARAYIEGGFYYALSIIEERLRQKQMQEPRLELSVVEQEQRAIIAGEQDNQRTILQDDISYHLFILYSIYGESQRARKAGELDGRTQRPRLKSGK